MKCSQCGLPVSPSRTKCPRCGIPVEEFAGKSEVKQAAAVFAQSPSTPVANTPDTIQPQLWPERQPSTTSAGAGLRRPHFKRIDNTPPPIYENLYGQQNQMDSSPSAVKPSPAYRERAQADTASAVLWWARVRGNLSGIFSRGTAGTRLGFTVAGICIGAGALILIFVFIMAQSLPLFDTAPALVVNQKTVQEAEVAATPTSMVEPTPTTVSATPTPATPGSKYIDTIQIGSIMNMNRVEITQATKNFKAGQRIYITMNVNSIGYQGAVCLDWYVQDTFLTHYAFATIADPSLPHSTAWSYAVSGRRGPGYVNVSWASSTACVDKVLAQHVDFTVDA